MFPIKKGDTEGGVYRRGGGELHVVSMLQVPVVRAV